MALIAQHLSIVHTQDLRPLINDLSFTLSPGDRLAVIGEEGDGKSTLLKLLYDPALIDGYAQYSGTIIKKGERPGYLPQELPLEAGDVPARVFCARNAAFASASPGETAVLCARLQLPGRVLQSEQPLSALSGGEKVKLSLLLTLLASPTLLLLDEPSNDLDLSALAFLENFINTCGLPVVYISHDETLLSRTANRVLHLEQVYRKTAPRWTLQNVSYDEYMRVRAAALQKQERLAQMEKREDRARQERFDRIENAVAHAQDTISRGDPHGGRLLKKKMKAVKSLEKRFEREREDMTTRPNVEYGLAASFDAGVSLPRGKVVLELTLPALKAGGRTLAQNVALRVAGPEKVLLLGENGAGKTTLLHLIAETLLPRRDITAAYMPQRYEELLCGEETPAEFLRAGGDKERLTRTRTYLGAAKFTTDEMAHPLSGLSGGQKAKLLFLKMILDGADTLILDEPTRNLSPLSAPVIRDLIRCFPGAVIAVTHDRLLMRELTDARVLRLTQDGLVPVSAQELAQI